MVVAEEPYVAVRQAALRTGIPQGRIRYWMMRDPDFPYGLRSNAPVVRISEVLEYFRRREEIVVVKELEDEGEEGEEMEEGDE